MERLPEDSGQPSSEAQAAGGGVGKAGANESILVGSECVYFPDSANRSVSALIHSVHALLNSRCITLCSCSLLTVCPHLSVCFMCVSLARPPPSFFYFFSFFLTFFTFFPFFSFCSVSLFCSHSCFVFYSLMASIFIRIF